MEGSLTAKLSPEKIIDLEEAAYQIRRLAIEMITYAKWGHPGGSLSMAEILAVLYFHEMNTDPCNPGWQDRDRLILSKAHSSPALYAALALKGFLSAGRDLHLLRAWRPRGPYRYDPHSGFRILWRSIGNGSFGGCRPCLWAPHERIPAPGYFASWETES